MGTINLWHDKSLTIDTHNQGENIFRLLRKFESHKHTLCRSCRSCSVRAHGGRLRSWSFWNSRCDSMGYCSRFSRLGNCACRWCIRWSCNGLSMLLIDMDRTSNYSSNRKNINLQIIRYSSVTQ